MPWHSQVHFHALFGFHHGVFGDEGVDAAGLVDLPGQGDQLAVDPHLQGGVQLVPALLLHPRSAQVHVHGEAPYHDWLELEVSSGMFHFELQGPG